VECRNFPFRKAFRSTGKTPPAAAGGGTVQPPVIGSVAAPVRNMFQTETIAVRLIWDCTWTVRRSDGVAWMSAMYH